MRSFSRLSFRHVFLVPCFWALALSVGAAPAARAETPSVAVTFVAPERYADARLDGGGYGRGVKADAPALREIRGHLEKLGGRYFTDGRRLAVEVLDVDLAGRFEPWRAFAHDVRFLRDVTWPRITLRYTLTRGDAVLLRGEETVSDFSYLMSPVARGSLQRLPYEKAMLDDWFRARFERMRPPPA